MQNLTQELIEHVHKFKRRIVKVGRQLGQEYSEQELMIHPRYAIIGFRGVLFICHYVVSRRECANGTWSSVNYLVQEKLTFHVVTVTVIPFAGRDFGLGIFLGCMHNGKQPYAALMRLFLTTSTNFRCAIRNIFIRAEAHTMDLNIY